MYLALGLGVTMLGVSTMFAATWPWDICDISVTPPAGAVPHTVTLSGTVYRSISSGFVEAYSSINWGDGFFSGPITGSVWVNPTHVRWYANHTYMTTGMYTITANVVYAIDPLFTWIDRNASAFCSSNNVAVGTKAPVNTGRVQPICGNGIVEAPEVCDEGVNNGMPGSACSLTCTPVMPKCNLTVNPNSGTAPLPVVATFTGFGGTVTSLFWWDGTSTVWPWIWTAATGVSFSAPHTYTTWGTFTISTTITNPYSPNYTTTCTATVNVKWASTNTGRVQPICGNGIVEAPEQCDAGVNNGQPGYGCDLSCNYTLPKCSLSIMPPSGVVPFTTTFTFTGLGGVINSIYWGEGPIAYGVWTGTGVPPTFTSGHTYMTPWVYSIVITYVNPLVPNLQTRCTASIYAGKKPIQPVLTGRVNTWVVINPVLTGRVNTGVVINPVLTGKVNTWVIINPVLTGRVIRSTTGIIIPVLSGVIRNPVVILSPRPILTTTGTVSIDVVSNITRWAYNYGITPVRLSEAQMYATVSRYGVAQMFVQFATRVMKQKITHNARCDVTKFSDYKTFTPAMITTITQVCDLGLMGLTANGQSLINAFSPSDQLTSDQLVTIINRYKPGTISSGTKLQNRNIDVLFQLLQIATSR